MYGVTHRLSGSKMVKTKRGIGGRSDAILGNCSCMKCDDRPDKEEI